MVTWNLLWSGGKGQLAGAYGWEHLCHLIVDCLQNVRASTSRYPMDTCGLLQW
jgi:hypothetical protein